jgi:Helicase conserved C-terminal domain
MVDAAPSAALAADDLQELKEAVCDAVLERTKRLVSGEGEHGRVVLGERPSRALSSGFLLPRLNADGDDESSDIRIAAHGVDFRIRTDGPGEIQIRPSFSVYVRALPSADELFARNGRLVPSADFSGPAKARLRDEIRKRLEHAPKPETRAAKLAMREAVARAVMESMGVVVPSGARVAGAEGDRDDDAAADAVVDRDVRTRLKIPNDVSRTYEVPHKWIRIPVHVSPLALSFPCDPDAWRQAGAAYKPVLIDAAQAAATAWITSPDGQAWAFRPRQVLSEELWGAAQWEQFLARARATAPSTAQLVPPLDIQILVDAVSDVLHPGIASLRIALENLREQDDRAESGIFGVSLEVDVADAAIVPLRLERVDRSYHLAGFLSMPAVGVNGGVDVREGVGGMRTLRTTWMPRYVLPRMRPAVLPRLPIAYEALANVATDVASLGDLVDEMRHWIVGVEDTTRLSWPGESGSPEDEARQQMRFRADIAAWRREADRVERGADLLKRSQAAWRRDPHGPAAIPYRAWHLLNTAFAHANPDREDSSQKPGWRLFQLGFVLAHIPTLASRLPEYESDFDQDFDENSASLLYMSTGGGKTEAFFGTIVFALFLDRLRGKHRGVTAMMHYPLRLLTIQQAQRLARLLAKAEIVRQTASPGGAPFEVGFWVGSSNTPNRTEQRAGVITAEVQCVPTWQARPIADEARLSGVDTGDRAYIAARDAWNKLPSCPFCGRPTGLRLFPEQHHRLGIVCTNEGGCPWGNAYKHQAAPEPLPFLLVDSDIYRRAPSILLGTVDKLALLGQSPQTVNRIAGMFGMARFVEGGDSGLLHAPDHDIDNVPPSYERLAPSWVDGRELFVDPFPSLIVQDEMHLLDESLGTFGGVFETALMAWLGELSTILGSRVCRVAADNRPRLPHVVGATATAADAAKHVGALYQKHVVQFPHPGPSLHDGFYVRLGEFAPGSAAYVERTEPTRSVDAHPREREIAAPWGRVYASLMTNGRLHTVTTLSVLAAHAATITRWLRDLGSGDSVRQDRAAREIRDNISDAAWSDRRRAAVARQIEEAGYDLLAALVDLHRIELTYVTNKKGGDQILSAITAEVLETHEAMGAEYALSDFRMELISGGVDVKGIQSVIRKAEEPFDSRRDDVSAMLRGIVATSAISHGVDVEAFNAMVFAGMPTDIAEYIQASSRVGRLHVGFSLLVPTPQARRDRFVVGVHEPFHRLLERMIAPPAIERWADRALQRTIPSLMQTWLAGVYHQHAFVAAASEAKTTVRFPATVEAVDAIFKGAAGARNFDACVAFVQRAIGIDAVANGPGKAEQYYRDVVRAGVHEVRAEIGSGSFTGFLRDFWANEQNPLRRHRPMLSLRDVDEAGTIQGSGLTLKNQRLRSGDLAAAMAVLRNRGVSRGRQSAMSEMDGEGTSDV